jgi:hypothetical protein
MFSWPLSGFANSYAGVGLNPFQQFFQAAFLKLAIRVKKKQELTATLKSKEVHPPRKAVIP